MLKYNKYNMFYMKTQVTIRDVDSEVFKMFKAEAIKKGLTLGSALTIAMLKFRKELTGKKLKFSDLKPVDMGKGTEHVSEEVDSILYGD